MKPVSEQSNEEWTADYDGEPLVTSITKLSSAKKTNIPTTAEVQTQNRGRLSQKNMAPKIAIPDDLPVLISEGVYEAKCFDYTFKEYFGSSKLVAKFEISEGRWSGTRLECFYNVARKTNANGEYILAPGKRSVYLRVMRQMFTEVFEAGGDWLSPDNLLGKTFRVHVVTVTQNHERESLGCNQYSKIKPAIERLHKLSGNLGL